MKQIVFATNNAHKLDEIRQIVGDSIQVLSLADIDCNDDIPEDADTLDGNALMKAQYIHDKYGMDCFSDDTGLEIDALGGEPGVYSARYGGVAHDSERNMDKVLAKLEGVPMEQRTARFRTVIALIEGDTITTFEGKVEGHILTERHGTEGFGYDPIFQPNEAGGPTFAEMTAQQKNAISHRGRATEKLVAHLLGAR